MKHEEWERYMKYRWQSSLISDLEHCLGFYTQEEVDIDYMDMIEADPVHVVH